jgi:nitroimidazol reductase NimA-like FMN-containing flavoprotein (pyridoxamine 5'-phosphate oxidase superfamily)
LKTLEITEKTKAGRLSDRASYNVQDIYDILDDAFVCSIAFTIKEQTYIIPTCYGREGGRIYFHGSALSRMNRNLKEGMNVCISVTNVDAVVLARSAFHHSINYRSVILFGRPEELTDDQEKTHGLKIITENIIPGRWNDVRPPDTNELKATAVFSLLINEASAKVRSAGVKDDPADKDLDVWAGLLPLKTIAGDPVPDPALKEGIPVPDYIINYKKKTSKP